MTSQPLSIHDLTPQQLRQFYSRNFNNGQFGRAFQFCIEAINREPKEKHHQQALSTIIRQVMITDYSPAAQSALHTCLDSEGVARQHFAQAWQALIKTSPDLLPLQALLKKHDYADFETAIQGDKVLSCLDNAFLVIGLRTLILIDMDLEILIRNLRRWILKQDSGKAPLSFLCALAEHAFLRDYVFFESADEQVQIDTLQTPIEAGEAGNHEIALYAAYRPLFRLKSAKAIQNKYKNEQALQALIEQQITNPLKEADIKKTITVISPIERETSQAVREMYEENPYPRWSSINIFPNPDEDARGNYLVAGCGTCKSLLQFAKKFPSMDITVIDLSQSSLAYGMRKAEELGVTNVTFAQCDILDLPKLNKTFNAIDCSGVLHHMKAPVEGWRALLSVLEPGGKMNIGLYSTRARTSIHAGWDYIKDKGYQPTAQDIRQFRDDVFKMPADHPVKPVSKRVDFFNLSQCRDLVFHIQETTYTPEDIQKILDELELVFEGFWLGQLKLETEFARDFPDDPQMRNLSNWSKLEERYPNMFNGMFQFICSRKSDEGLENPTWDSIVNGKIFTLTGQKTA